jgi:DNA-binding PadR family transcriptional regulator
MEYDSCRAGARERFRNWRRMRSEEGFMRHGRHGRGWFAGWEAGMGPWGRGSRFFDTGEVRLAILSLLESGPKHGYQVIKDLEERSGGLYRASAGAVYPNLQQLEDEGLVTSATQDGKRVYTLTDGGRSELEREKDRVGEIWNRTQEWGVWAPGAGPEGAMVATTAALVLKAALQAVKRTGGNAEEATRIRDILDRARREIESIKPKAE